MEDEGIIIKLDLKKKKSIEAGKTLGKKLKEQSGGDYKK